MAGGGEWRGRQFYTTADGRQADASRSRGGLILSYDVHRTLSAQFPLVSRVVKMAAFAFFLQVY